MDAQANTDRFDIEVATMLSNIMEQVKPTLVEMMSTSFRKLSDKYKSILSLSQFDNESTDSSITKLWAKVNRAISFNN